MNDRPKPRWIKLYTDMFDNEKLQLILTMPKGRDISYIWVRLLCLAGKLNNGGVMEMDGGLVIDEKTMTKIFHAPLATVQLALSTLESLGMIQRRGEVVCLPDWEEHQSLDKLQSRKEYARRYMQKRREESRQQELLSPRQQEPEYAPDVNSCDVNSKHSVNTQEENRIEQKGLDENSAEQISEEYNGGAPASAGADAFAAFALDDEKLFFALKDFERMRLSLGKPLTRRSKELLCKKLEPYGAGERVRMLEESILHCWSDVYEPSDPPQRGVKTAAHSSNPVTVEDMKAFLEHANAWA